jgi:hypothetical protein
MTKANHTPGPWIIGSAEGRVLSHWEGIGYWEIANATITDFRGDSGARYFAGGTQEANARLIAAAPNLLEALEELTEIIDKAGLLNLSNGVQLGPTAWYVKATERMDYARAAIAKAKGE